MYETAAGGAFKLPYVNRNGLYYKVWETTQLEAQAEIRVKEIAANQSKVTVNIAYFFTLSTRYENSRLSKSAPAAEKVSVQFTTNIPAEVNLGNAQSPFYVTPQSKGVLERAVLKLAAGNRAD